jgi:hypothetical protein
MFANGFTAELLVELVCAGLAAAQTEREVPVSRTFEVARNPFALMLRLDRRLGPLSGCRFFNAVQIRGQDRTLRVFFLLTFGVDARRWLRWILNPPR